MVLTTQFKRQSYTDPSWGRGTFVFLLLSPTHLSLNPNLATWGLGKGGGSREDGLGYLTRQEGREI